MDDKIKILITGGGTGGHVFPAIAIADALKKLRPDAEFLSSGQKGAWRWSVCPRPDTISWG
jgi:UDP-N-acetylglucosamine:LPS N-acetylglucosamine transferase